MDTSTDSEEVDMELELGSDRKLPEADLTDLCESELLVTSGAPRSSTLLEQAMEILASLPQQSKMAEPLQSTVERLDRPSAYYLGKNKRRRNRGDEGEAPPEPQEDPLKDATTLYVGNLSFYTTEEQIHELFSKCGEIKRIIMGLDRFQKTPCGFCFVEYYTHQDALDCMKYIGGTKLDERIIRTDLDPGFQEGRQYGRGKSGGQVRDEYRDEFDPGRGGFGRSEEQNGNSGRLR